MIEVVLTAPADDDLTSIFDESMERWGPEQAAKYRAAIDAALERIRRFPDSGAPRPRLGVGVPMAVAKKHLIFYRHLEHRVVVLRVLHGRMDVAEALREP